ncbi:MAG: hypothetical protein EOO08_09410 [Chitinophagaceae bacterium]|nr:MAG: hypothetical protein EOO08_09410 [Chitinophagaceae bacterium]
MYHSALIFCCWVAVLLPFPWHLLAFQQHMLPEIFGAGLYRSDSAAQAVLYAACAGAGFLCALLLLRISTERRSVVVGLLRSLLLCYLAAVLARYGADKILKIQFYLPEPTTLYTNFGDLEKDTLYWSTLGTSRPYNLFLGTAELFAALLLLFRRTRRGGLLLALTVFIQVLAVDVCFGIGVQLFSGFLLLLTVLLLAPDARNWLDFFLGRGAAAVAGDAPATRVVRKYGVMLLIAVEAAWPLLQGKPWNDDAALRPPLHGAYQIEWQSPASLLPRASMAFVHRAGYLVLKDGATMHPYQLRTDTAGSELRLLMNGQWKAIRYEAGGDSTLTLFYNNLPVLRSKALNWRALPALK